MGILIIAIIIGLIPACIAGSKGRSFIGWWIYGVLLFIIALPHALLLKSDQSSIEKKQMSEGMKKCPFCAEMIKSAAKVCRYCGRDLPMPDSSYSLESAVSESVPEKVNILRERLQDSDVVCFAKATETEWLCICGTINKLDKTKKIQNCSKCHRNRDVVLEQNQEIGFKY